jgi:hypothetical protein
MMQASYGIAIGTRKFLVPEDLGPGVDKYRNFNLQEVKVLGRSSSLRLYAVFVKAGSSKPSSVINFPTVLLSEHCSPCIGPLFITFSLWLSQGAF